MADIFEILKTEPESEIIEYKEAKNQFDIDKLGQYFSALSNEANLKGALCAYLFLGVRNDRSVQGTNIPDKKINEYKHEIAKNTSPSMSFIDIKKHSTGQGRVLCCIIPSAPKGIPIAWKGHYYGRNGESLSALDLTEIERIRRQNTIDDWSIKTISAASLDDLSEEAIAFARKQYEEKNPKLKDEISSWNNETFLNKAKLTINGKITNAAILLLGKPDSEHFISPAQAKITWILKDKDGIEKDYEHFSCPFILSAEKVFKKIRNIIYRYLPYDSIFTEEVQQYDPYIIREALNNCIAHQDYTMCGKIVLIEKEDGELIFTNMGEFIPGTVEKVINDDSPESIYRNSFLANAMVNLNMIDTIGSGIRKMFNIQRHKFFPLPEYDFSNRSVKLTIIGKVQNFDYAKKLAEEGNLPLQTIMLLDKVQKKKKLASDEFKFLKENGLIEGKKNNYYFSSAVAKITSQETDYIKLKGINDDYCKKMIMDYIEKFGSATKAKLEELLLEKLPDSMTVAQKKNKIKNLLQSLKKAGKLMPQGKNWQMSKNV
jgi:ATP-dependent DNA helicase RecG